MGRTELDYEQFMTEQMGVSRPTLTDQFMDLMSMIGMGGMGGVTSKISTLLKKYKPVGSKVGKLKIGNIVKNTDSIPASFSNYKVLPKIREVPLSDFGGSETFFYAADDFAKSRKLAAKIRETKRIDPLIVAVDNEGPYILEGAHRFEALREIGAEKFPALIVQDLD